MFSMNICIISQSWKLALSFLLLSVLLLTAPLLLNAQTPAAPTQPPAVPTWAQPGSAAHTQTAPPPDFHRPSKNFATPIGIFEGQSDIGSAVVPGSASYDAGTKRYTINSAGYNVWYTRDEFRYLWKKMSGDVSLAADISYPRSQRLRRPQSCPRHSPGPRRRFKRGHRRPPRPRYDPPGTAREKNVRVKEWSSA